jgi:UDP-N-acetylglucosamine 2-epimerase (non-hydrolysing)
MTKKMKIMTVVGTRPEIIRLSRTMALLDEHVNHVIVHTGQNYDYELNEIFWEDMELRKSDHFLGIATSSLGASVGDIVRQSEKILKQENPDALLVLGDTNSCLSAYMAKRMHIPIFHMEAGNRCFDFNVPEEINRRIIDHIADYNLVYTEHARRHLLSEGLPHNRIYLTGSPMKEVLIYYKPKIDTSNVKEKLNLDKKGYFLVSAHREENVDAPENLEKILNIMNALAEEYKLPVIVSTHPRTRKRIEDLKDYNPNELIHFMKPFGYFDYIHLQQHAKCVLSDSGTVSEESAILSFPAITIRNSMERPEAIDQGTIILTGLINDIVLGSVRLVIKEFERRSKYNKICREYQIENTSWRVLKVILGNTKLSNKRWGINI